MDIVIDNVANSLPNVKDEPRRDLARLVPHLGFDYAVSFRKHIPSHEA